MHPEPSWGQAARSIGFLVLGLLLLIAASIAMMATSFPEGSSFWERTDVPGYRKVFAAFGVALLLASALRLTWRGLDQRRG